MARLSATQWEKARAEYEVRGISLGAVAELFGVDRAAVSRRAKKESWVQGKNHGVVEKKVTALKALAEADEESHALPVTFQHTVETVVRERLQAEGMLASLDVALASRGVVLASGAKTADEWEMMTRGRRNLAPQVQRGISVNVNQDNTNQNQTAVLPTPSPTPEDAMRKVLRGQYEGDEV